MHHKADRKVIADVNKYGCHVMSDEEHPPFSYSIGVQQTAGKPECVVIGLKRDLAHSMVDGYHRRVKAGEEFVPGKFYSDFIEGFDCQVRDVHPSHYEEYFGFNLWFYKGRAFKVIQLVWPTTKGNWPWDPEASEWYLSQQPLLDMPANEDEL